MKSADSYVKEISDIFEKNSDSSNALPMKKYLKDLFEFYGIKTPERNELTKEYLVKSKLPPLNLLPQIVRKFWSLPERENQYFAMRLTEKYVRQIDASFIELYEFMIINKSWWDTVDFIAANLVGSLFKKDDELVIPYTEKWMASENMWLQRTCILFQLKYKKNTDTKLLFDLIEKLKHSNEFFIRKAIGWALREYSKTDPQTVLKFVSSNNLSGLSSREALRLIK